MNPRLEAMKRRVRAGEHRSVRQPAPIDVLAECEADRLSWPRTWRVWSAANAKRSRL